jgi:nucleoside-diphosphate-sugar epimerase
MNTIAITGASGYIGRHLVAGLAESGTYRLRLLSRNGHIETDAAATNATVVRGDLLNAEAVRDLVEPADSVIHLAYLWEGGEEGNMTATRNLITACSASAATRRLLHCSTAMVAGRTDADRISEDTTCEPVSQYGAVKLRIEQAVASACSSALDVGILRPTAVFGPGGKNLAKLAAGVARGNRAANYLRSSLFGYRRMNLVHIDNVVAALIFLLQYPERLNGQAFIVSDADDPANNFRDVEKVLMHEMGRPAYPAPPLPLPAGLLQLLLSGLGRDNTNPRADYYPGKLQALGFERSVKLEQGLRQYARWYRDHG